MTDRRAPRGRGGCVAPDDEARELLLDAPDATELDARLCRREAGEPLAWITGHDVRRHHRARRSRGVRPACADRGAGAAGGGGAAGAGTAVDLCTGSGAVAAWLQRAVPDVFAASVDLGVARRPVMRRAAAAWRGRRVTARPCATASGACCRRTCNATTAARVDGGDDGLAVVRRVVAHAATLLRAGGHLLLELGGEQDVALAPDLARRGFTAVEPWHDDDGDLRGLLVAPAVR